MTAKEYLQQVKKCDSMIERKLEEIQSLRSMVTSISVALKDDVVQSGGASDKIGNTVSRIVDLENELNTNIDIFIDLKREVMNSIEALEDSRCTEILYKRYFQYKTWEQIACEMDLSYQWVCNLHGKALNALVWKEN